MTKPTLREKSAASRTSLRDRAADVSASAARVLKRQKTEQPTLGSVASSPVSDLRDRWRVALEAVNQPGLPEATFQRLSAAASEAERAVVDARVSTIQDLACKVEVLRSNFDQNSLDEGVAFETVQAVCDGVDGLAAAAEGPRIADPIVAAIAAHHEAFRVANSQPTDRLSEAACVRHDAVYKQLAHTTPTTPEGICALAAHLRQFLKEAQVEIRDTFDGEALTVLLNAIDRFAIARGRQVEIATDQGLSLAKTQADALSLEGLHIAQLSNLFDVFEAVHTHWLAVGCQPFAKVYDPVDGVCPNAAGEITEQEATRAALIRDRIADRVRLQNPKSDWERDDRLSLRIKDQLLCEGRILDRDLLLELVKVWG